MAVVAEVEQALRRHLQPAKVNVASLGNAVPHLHWHVVARFEWDSHFPKPVWGVAERTPADERLQEVESALQGVEADLRRNFR
jgi:diadenosine tetraphosphate (Ap4A) HIT family hydrolase